MQYWVIDEEVQVEVVDDVIDDVAWLLATPLDPIWQVSNFCWRWTLKFIKGLGCLQHICGE